MQTIKQPSCFSQSVCDRDLQNRIIELDIFVVEYVEGVGRDQNAKEEHDLIRCAITRVINVTVRQVSFRCFTAVRLHAHAAIVPGGACNPDRT